MTRWLLTVSIIAAFNLGASPMAFADKLKTEGNFNCGFSKKIQKGRFYKKVREGRISKEALKAAKRALDNGYNYGLLVPFQLTDNTYVASTENVYGGRKRNYEYTVDYETQGCRAFDDVSAIEYHFGGFEKIDASSGAAVVSFRDIVSAFGSESDRSRYGLLSAARSNISEERYERPGDKELIARLYPVQRKAAQCLAQWTPAGPRDFSFTPSGSALAEQERCLAGLRDEARAVGWDALSAAPDNSASSSGYSLNPQGPVVAKSVDGQEFGRVADASKWGEGWTDITADFPGAGGIILTRPKSQSSRHKDVIIVVASNNSDQTPGMEAALFHMARLNMSGKRSGIALADKTEGYVDNYESSKADFIRKAERKAGGSSSERKIQRLEDDIEDLEDDIAQMPRKKAELMEQKEQILKYTAGYPEQRKVATEQFDQLLADYDERSAAKQIKLDQKRAELADLKMEGSGVAPVSNIGRVSETKKGQQKGIYRAIEDYQFVRVYNGLGDQFRCYARYMVCADKVAAYNAIGPKLNAGGYSAISSPPGYEQFDTTVKD